MAEGAVLPVVNNDSRVVDTLQSYIDDRIVRDNEDRELFEQQIEIMNSIQDKVANIFNLSDREGQEASESSGRALSAILENQEAYIDVWLDFSSSLLERAGEITQLLQRMIGMSESQFEQLQERQERQAIEQDIEEERGEDVVTDQTRGTDMDVERGAGISTIVSVISAAALAWVYELDAAIKAMIPKSVAKVTASLGRVFFFPVKVLNSAIDSLTGLNIAGQVRTAVTSVFMAPLNILRTVKDTFAARFSGIANMFSNTFKAISSGIGKVSAVFSKIGGIISKLPVLGRLLGPFGIIVFGIIDFMQGFINGFQEKGILEGLKKGFNNLTAKLIGAPLDFIKNLTAWVGEKLGFDTEFMNEFSFEQLIRDALNKLWGFMSDVADVIKNPLDFLSSTAKKALQFFGIIEGGDQAEKVEDVENREGEEVPERDESSASRGGRAAMMAKARESVESQNGGDSVDTNGMKKAGEDVAKETTNGSPAGGRGGQGTGGGNQGNGGGTTVVAPQTTNNSSTQVNNNRTVVVNRPHARSDDHTFKNYQSNRAFAGR